MANTYINKELWFYRVVFYTVVCIYITVIIVRIVFDISKFILEYLLLIMSWHYRGFSLFIKIIYLYYFFTSDIWPLHFILLALTFQLTHVQITLINKQYQFLTKQWRIKYRTRFNLTQVILLHITLQQNFLQSYIVPTSRCALVSKKSLRSFLRRALGKSL